MRILHITHTDVTNDSRIEKEIDVALKIPASKLFCYFVVSDKFSKEFLKDNVKYLQRSSITDGCKWLGRSTRHIIKIIELSFSIILSGYRIRPDIIHAHDTLVLPAATILAILTRAKLIYDAHELESNKNGQSKFMRVGTYTLECLCWWRLNGFITVSESIREWYFTRFSHLQNEIILNSPSYHSKNKSCLRDVLEINSDSLVVIYIGYLSKGRGIENTLEAYSSINTNSDLVFMGSGDLEPLIQSYVSKYKNIHIHPPVPHEKVVEYASGADLGLCVIENVSLSDYLCLPNKLFEYAFSGLKVIGSDFPEISRVLTKYELGFVIDGSPKSIKKIVESTQKNNIKNNNNLYSLSWKFQAEKLRSLYERL